MTFPKAPREDAASRPPRPANGERLQTRLRGRAGVEQRRRRLAAEPECRDCREVGKRTPSTVPDHIIPLALGGTDDDSNIRCLCAEHHRIRTAEQFGREAWRGVGPDGWPL